MLYSAAVAVGLLDARTHANLTAIVVLSMVLTPLVVLVVRRLLPKPEAPSLAGVEAANGLEGSVLVIGFGRFGQVSSQALLARGVDVTIIDNDIGMITSAADFGFKVYYGDGTRLDVLHASGAGRARVIAVCVDDRAAATRIAEVVRSAFPQAAVLVRSFDREHALELVRIGVDLQVRETFESAVVFGGAALRELGVDEDEALMVMDEVRRLDAERFALETAAGTAAAGAALMHTNTGAGRMRQTPLVRPKATGQVLNPDEAVSPAPAADGRKASSPD